jgi:hypothetical protein
MLMGGGSASRQMVARRLPESGHRAVMAATTFNGMPLFEG